MRDRPHLSYHKLPQRLGRNLARGMRCYIVDWTSLRCAAAQYNQNLHTDQTELPIFGILKNGHRTNAFFTRHYICKVFITNIRAFLLG